MLFRLRSVCHATAGYSNGMPGMVARCTTGVDVACSVYPLLAFLCDLIVCHVRLEATDEGLTSIKLRFLFLI